MVGLLRSLHKVALLAEGVDRNSRRWHPHGGHTEVALLAEGVDRNLGQSATGDAADVALLAEGVDRNW